MVHKLIYKLIFIVSVTFPAIYCSQANKCNFNVCNVDEDALKFFVLGDWGGDSAHPFTTEIQRNVAKATNQLAISKNVNFYVSTGDHFYPSGVRSADDPRFKTTFEDAFGEQGHQKIWHLSTGNHDYYTNISAQIAYSEKSWRWNFPDYYYTVEYESRHKSMADFIFIDTIMLCGNTRGTPDEVPRGPTNIESAELHWFWMDNRLRESKYNFVSILRKVAPYLFIVGHYPPRSKGRHGPTTPCFVDRIERLMRKYNVTAFLAGHDHNMQHYRYTAQDGRTFDHVVSGLGAMYNEIQSRDIGNGGKSLFFYPDTRKSQTNPLLKETEKGGFNLVTLNRSNGLVQFYNGDAVELYSFNLLPRKTVPK